MGLNPFKESNFDDLKQQLRDFFSELFGSWKDDFSDWWKRFKKKGNERVTIMFIPHNEKKIVNFHISIFAISGIAGALALVIVITSFLVLNHTSTVKEVSRLELYQSDSTVQIQHYKEEIKKLDFTFQQFQSAITGLYILTPDYEMLGAKGGGTAPLSDKAEGGPDAPGVEALCIEEMEKELRTTKDVLEKIKIFMEQRKKIIENTPSLWPVNGYIVSAFGVRNSPFSFKEEFNKGIDIASYPGAEIHVTAPGTIDSVKWNSSDGLTVSVKHKYGFTTVYSHCQ
ncbi:MAG: M23 family metallopeptidase, partial [Spirochaetota bacterium]